jgi:competence protein ComEC
VVLSYLATLGLILGARRSAAVVAALLGAGGARALPRTSGLPSSRPRVLLARAGRLAVVTLGASLAAVAATLGAAWAFFGETCPSGILATALALPLVAWLLVAGWATLLVGPGAAGPLFALPAGWLVSFLEVWDALPGTPWALPLRPWPALAAAQALTLGALGGSRGLARVAALAWAVLLLPWSPAPEGLELVLLDVGHGTAAVVRAPGLPGLVFDAGSRDRSGVDREALGPLLAAWEVRRPVVVLSHADRDHASALPWLVERRPPGLFAGALPAPLGERLAHTTPRLDPPQGPSSVPLTLGGGLRGRLLRGAPGAGNEGSRALLLELGGTRVALLGDAEGEGLAALLRAGTLQGPCDVLLAPHHGSATPWLVPLLEALEPREVWISAPEVPPIAGELERRGIPWRCTGRDGPLSFRAPWHGLREERSQ